MSEQKPKVGKKDAGRKIARKFSELRRRPISKKVLEIIEEISERELATYRKVARSHNEEV